MREIKFRAWDKEAKKFWLWEDLKTKIANFFELEFLDVQQYTGLKDKNGKEIYEGDIVKGKSNYSELLNQVVEFDESLAGFEPFCDYDVDCDEYYEKKGCEVIGNVFENPDLSTSK